MVHTRLSLPLHTNQNFPPQWGSAETLREHIQERVLGLLGFLPTYKVTTISKKVNGEIWVTVVAEVSELNYG